jgi:hypothetical protein
VTVEVYRNLIQATADDTRVGFAKALQVINNFEKMPPDEFKASAESLIMLTEEAARYGVPVSELAKIMLDYDDEETPGGH